jgi:hypothetical protein
MELLNSVKKERDRLLNTKIKTQKVGLPFFLKLKNTEFQATAPSYL